MIPFCILFWIFWISNCAWTENSLVRKGDSLYSPGTYVDTSTGITYHFFANNTVTEMNIESDICCRVYPASSESFTTFCHRQKKEVINITVAGKNDGKTIFLAFSARRRLKAKECTKSNAEGCFDIFFTETQDGGKTWSTPAAVPRPDLNDPVHRTSPKLLAIQDIDRLFLAYSYFESNRNLYHLASVTRPSKSIIFNKETKIDNWQFPFYDLSFALAKYERLIHIYMFLVTHNGIIRFTSSNFGVFWTSIYLRSDSTNYSYAVASSWEEDQIYIVSVGANNVFMINWRESDMSWHQRILKLTNKVEAYRPIIATIPSMNHTFLFTAPIGPEGVITKLYDTEYEYMKDLKDKAPISPYLDATAYKMGKDLIKLRILHYISKDLYATSYSFST